jgi:hypothetical protein
LYKAVLTPPMCRGPVGDGAKRSLGCIVSYLESKGSHSPKIY